MRIRMLSVKALAICLLLNTLGMGALANPFPDDPIETVHDILESCSNQTIGDMVGYTHRPINYGPSVNGFDLIISNDYGAVGFFSGGDYEKRAGSFYYVYEIKYGYSRTADWCEGTSLHVT